VKSAEVKHEISPNKRTYFVRVSAIASKIFLKAEARTKQKHKIPELLDNF
jgi:hypothetical protein